VKLHPKALLRPTDTQTQLDGLGGMHSPGEGVVYIRSSGPVGFGARGIVLAVQADRCEVVFEKESFCGTGHFAQLRSCRAAILPSSSLLNLSRPLPYALRSEISKKGSAADEQGAAEGRQQQQPLGLSVIANRYSVLAEDFHLS